MTMKEAQNERFREKESRRFYGGEAFLHQTALKKKKKNCKKSKHKCRHKKNGTRTGTGTRETTDDDDDGDDVPAFGSGVRAENARGLSKRRRRFRYALKLSFFCISSCVMMMKVFFFLGE